MIKTPQFDLWLRIATGRIAAFESNFSVPPSEVKIEVRSGGRWVEIQATELQA